MSDFETQPDQPGAMTPPCPVCGGSTILVVVHKAIQSALDIFRCTVCHVHYPVVKRPPADA